MDVRTAGWTEVIKPAAQEDFARGARPGDTLFDSSTGETFCTVIEHPNGWMTGTDPTGAIVDILPYRRIVVRHASGVIAAQRGNGES